MAPDIGKIEVQRLEHDPSWEDVSSQLLKRCNPRRLRTYRVDASLSASAISHVIQLPWLESLLLVAVNSSLRFPIPLPNLVFPSLRTLHVDSDGDLAWLKLLPESPVLSEVYVKCTGRVGQFMETFQLTTAGCGMRKRLRKFSLQGREGFTITPQIIACNLLFENLTSLQLLSDCSTTCRTENLTDEDIDLLTNAMPSLKILAIGKQPCSVPSKITFKGLYTISRRCTQLESLQIHFNPNSFVQKVADPAVGVFETPSSVLCSVTKIDVGGIAFPTSQSDLSSVCAFGLQGIFPRLKEVVYRDVGWKKVHLRLLWLRRVHGAFVKE